MRVPDLFMLLDLLLFGVGDYGLQLVETFLHQREAESGSLLLLSDSFQLSSPHLLCNAGTLLPLLDPLGEDLIDSAAGQRCTVSLRCHTRLRASTLTLDSLGGELHAAVLGAVFGVGPCRLDAAWTQALP